MEMVSSSTQTIKFTSRLEKHHFQSSLRDLYNRWNLDSQHDWAYSLSYFTDHQGNQVQLPIQQTHHTMTEEVAAFAHMIQQPDLNLYQTWLDDAGSVHELLYTMRQTAGIRFEAEKWKPNYRLNGKNWVTNSVSKNSPHSNSTIWSPSYWRKPPRSEPNRNW